MADEQSSSKPWEAVVDEVDYLDRDDAIRLIEWLAERGAADEELAEAARTGTLGPLALELAVRPPGERLPFDEAVRQAGLDVEEAARLWRALGFTDPLDPPLRVTAGEVETLQKLISNSRAMLGPDAGQPLARVIGSTMTQLADAIVDTFRVQVEIPRRGRGEPYSHVVEDYARAGAVVIPELAAAVGDVLVGHILAASRANWVPDEQRSAVTRDLTVGFADVVDYTRSARALTPAELAAAIGRFESRVGELVGRHRGRVVKLIGDEVMFVTEDPGAAARLALAIIAELRTDPQMPQVRIGLAAGPVVTLQGDYYGDVVNLAARLVKAAEPGGALVSESVAQHASAQLVELPPLKGFDAEVAAYRLTG